MISDKVEQMKKIFFDKWSICFFVRPPYVKGQKVENIKH